MWNLDGGQWVAGTVRDKLWLIRMSFPWGSQWRLDGLAQTSRASALRDHLDRCLKNEYSVPLTTLNS